MSEPKQREQSDWKATLAFYSDFFGVLGGIALVVSFFLWLTDHRTLFGYSLFAGCLFLFLWMLHFVFKSGNASPATLGSLLPVTPKQPGENRRARVQPKAVTPKIQRPNLVCQRIDSFKVDYADNGFRRIVEGMYTAKTAVIVNVPNDDSPITSIRRVVAQITFNSEQEQNIVVNRGAWVGEEVNATDFPISTARWLIIALTDSSGMVYAVEDHRESTTKLGSPTFKELMRGTYDVDVKLIHTTNGTTISNFKLKLAPDTFRLWSVES